MRGISARGRHVAATQPHTWRVWRRSVGAATPPRVVRPGDLVPTPGRAGGAGGAADDRAEVPTYPPLSKESGPTRTLTHAEVVHDVVA